MALRDIRLISPRVRKDAAALRRRFEAAKPFPHLILDEFFDPDFAAELGRQFPPYDAERFVDALGQPSRGRHRDYGRLGPAYRRLEKLAAGAPFLKLLESLTGVEEVLADPDTIVGGARDCPPGFDMSPHLDPSGFAETGMHRRLTFLLYLTPGWRPAWGGELELSSGAGARPEVRIQPLFNRCVVFATNADSWHSVARVATPETVPPTTRRLIALYFYTREPAAEGAAPPDSVKVLLPLPEALKPGAVWDAALAKRVDESLLVREMEIADDSPNSMRGRISPFAERPKPGAILSREDVGWIKGLFEERERAVEARYRVLRQIYSFASEFRTGRES